MLMWGVAALLGLVGLLCIGGLIVFLFFLRTLSRTLERCHPDNQAMRPGLVWLNLIPCFNVVWQFVTVIKVGDSLKHEFSDRQMDEGGDYGKTLGLAAILIGMVGGFAQNIPPLIAPNDPTMMILGQGIGGLMSMAQLTLFVLYWVRIAGYGRELADDAYEHGELADEEDDDDFDDDPRPLPPTDPPPLPPEVPPHDPLR